MPSESVRLWAVRVLTVFCRAVVPVYEYHCLRPKLHYTGTGRV